MSRILQRIEREMTTRKRTRTQVWVRRLTLWFFVVTVPLLAAEVALRVAGFYRPLIPMRTQMRTCAEAAARLNIRFETDAFEADRFLLWRMKPGANVGGLTVTPTGLLGQDTGARPQQKRFRILCMGDSVSALTYRTYPHIAQRLMDQGAPSKQVEFLNAAVAGYTTEQALRWMPRLRAVRPQIVVVCLGWNDQFPALNLPDKELGARNAAAALAQQWFRQTRLYQFVAAPSGERLRRADPETTGSPRVSPAEYARNLRRLAAAIRADSALPVLATQPDNLNDANAEFFLRQNFVAGRLPLKELHQQYNATVRDAARELGCPLLDLEEEFDRRNKNQLFEPDGVHLSGAGHNLVARLLIGVLRNNGVITGEEFQRVVNAARYDSTAPDKPHAAWRLEPENAECVTTQTVRIGVLAKNSGNTRMLRSHVVPVFGTARNVAYGGVSIAGYWRSSGVPTTGPAALTRLSHDLLPGESTSQTLTFTAPPAPGIYSMEIGLTADQIGDLKHFGAEITTLTVTTRARQEHPE